MFCMCVRYTHAYVFEHTCTRARDWSELEFVARPRSVGLCQGGRCIVLPPAPGDEQHHGPQRQGGMGVWGYGGAWGRYREGSTQASTHPRDRERFAHIGEGTRVAPPIRRREFARQRGRYSHAQSSSSLEGSGVGVARK